MGASKILSAADRLYLICDGETCKKNGLAPADFVAAAGDAGALTIQYRHKGISATEYEREIANLLDRHLTLTLIVNDFAEVAQRYALPVHLGQEDPIPEELTVPYGRSTHNLGELDLALAATPKPDYVALGTMFPSSTKPGVGSNRALVETYLDLTPLPLVLIGGITLENRPQLPSAERIYYAVISDAFRFGASAAGIAKYVRAWRSTFSEP